MKIVVIGGTGLIGSAVVPLLRHHGHDAVAASRRTGVDTVSRAGLADALTGASVVIDVADSPSLEYDAAMHFFETSTRNLLAAEAAAEVRHHVALSVVGADRLPEIGYFRAKLVQENLVMTSPIPFTVVRATQFFEFLMRIADAATDGDAVRLAPVPVQPIAADDVVSVLARVAVGSPSNGVVEIAGPDRFRFDELMWDDLSARDDPRSVVTDERARHFGALLTERSLVPRDGAWLGRTRFADWLLHHRTTLAAEVALVQSSHLDDAMREPVADWRFDPAEAQWYDAVLHDLRDAVVHGKRRTGAGR
ncbi:SDR family oxidoreductase [Jiangella ureilytica]|uniref:SDR family oxidoreductase n=1 Tax=Jiangella ureilytica TaxID=2530374 RepID=A0A4R4RTL3_9ACTN|nr:SDR family oxidoreductase [Jiangella ureilytica]TDC52984.1 SDR family oxidoreductase [Jiangella ureilytica]